MIVEYDKETSMIYLSKKIGDRWIQVGLTNDEFDQIVEARRKNTRLIFSDKEIEFCKATCGNDSPCSELCNEFEITFNYK
jgi:hypothetical protein